MTVNSAAASTQPRPAPKAAPKPTAPTGALHRGNIGPQVRVLQSDLVKLGFMKQSGMNTGPGIFGPRTEAAVTAFQRAHHLAPTGVYGSAERAALNKALANRDTFQPAHPTPVTPTPGVTPPKSGNPFIDRIAAGAMAARKKYGVPASVTIAQAILESGWGKHDLHANNLFGIKGTGPAGSVVVPTREWVTRPTGHYVTINARFKKYHSVAESMEDHAHLLATSGYYQKAMAHRNDPRAFANALTGVYATEPSYGQKLISLMNEYHLYRYDR